MHGLKQAFDPSKFNFTLISPDKELICILRKQRYRYCPSVLKVLIKLIPGSGWALMLTEFKIWRVYGFLRKTIICPNWIYRYLYC